MMRMMMRLNIGLRHRWGYVRAQKRTRSMRADDSGGFGE
jgi:hypothetical protein